MNELINRINTNKKSSFDQKLSFINMKARDIKVVILGDAGVGKTSILNRFSNKGFDENSQTTLGASFIPKVMTKGDKTYKFQVLNIQNILDVQQKHILQFYQFQKQKLPNNNFYFFQIWDTAGQEKYRSLAPLYYRDSHAALIVYDITNKNSFDVLKKWVGELRQHGPANIAIAVVGNKVDLIEREDVKYDDAKSYANGLNAIFQYTSAKENQNIESLFIQIAEKVEERDNNPKPQANKGFQNQVQPKQQGDCNC
ncbi:hypothetical protein ABPG72_019206 [Tetrahymena utriculariae]